MILGFHGATSMKADLVTDVKVTAEAGFSALELWAAKIDVYLKENSLADLSSFLKDKHIAPLSLNSLEFIAFRGEEYTQIKTRCRQLCQIAWAIGCPTVVVVPSPTPERDLAWRVVVDEYGSVLNDLSAIAREFDVKLAFELLGFGWCSVRTPRGAWEIIQESGCDNVGLVIDAAHFYGGGGLMSEIDLLDPRRIYTFHLDDLEDGPKEAITDAKRLLPGLGVVPLGDICARLKAIGYDGACSIELFRPEYWDWDPKLLAVEARKAALNVLAPFFSIQ